MRQIDKTTTYIDKYDLNKIPDSAIIESLQKDLKTLSQTIGEQKSYIQELEYLVKQYKTDAYSFREIQKNYNDLKENFNKKLEEKYQKEKQMYENRLLEKDLIINKLLKK